MNLIFIILDAVVIFLMISTIIETSKAIAAFELDPRSRPPFDIGRAGKLGLWLFNFYKYQFLADFEPDIKSLSIKIIWFL